MEEPVVKTDLRDGFVYATFIPADLAPEAVVQSAGKELCALVDDGHRNIFVSFEGVTRTCSSLLGKLIVLQRRLGEKEGKLVIYANPHFMDVFRITQLLGYFTFLSPEKASEYFKS
jgi:anti-anti-sigma regulatory factor